MENGPILIPDGIDYQRVAFVTADGLSEPRWRHMRRMGLVQTYLAELMVEGIIKVTLSACWITCIS
jgi:hypothetical protein